jgi:putative acyl-CoA dehydrogenase
MLRLQIVKRQFSVATHEVFNQASLLGSYNMFRADPVMSTSQFIQPQYRNQVDQYGKLCGSSESVKHAMLAEKNKPVLQQFDIHGRRVDVIDFHASYHVLMSQALKNGVSGYGHATDTPGSHITRAALIYIQNQLEPGHCCPLVMTTAAVPPLKRWNMTEYVDKLCAFDYDPRDVPVEEKTAITAGMSMTEKQGGSDVRANTTMATPEDPTTIGNGAAYRLVGHKVTRVFDLPP